MTQQEAAAIIARLIKGYPTQRRDADFQGMLALELVASGLSFGVVDARAAAWIRAEKYWPAISDLIEPLTTSPQPMKLLPPPNPIPAEQGLALMKAAIEGAEPHV